MKKSTNNISIHILDFFLSLFKLFKLEKMLFDICCQDVVNDILSNLNNSFIIDIFKNITFIFS